MISQKLIDLIKDNADELTRRLMKDLLGREETKSYRSLPEDLIYERVFDVYNRLDKWLGKERLKEDVQLYYIQLGRKRFKEGIPLHELVMCFMLIKRHLGLYVLEAHFLDSVYEMHQVLELNNRVVLFFDRMIYFSIIGYEQETEKIKADKSAGLISRLFGRA